MLAEELIDHIGRVQSVRIAKLEDSDRGDLGAGFVQGLDHLVHEIERLSRPAHHDGIRLCVGGCDDLRVDVAGALLAVTALLTATSPSLAPHRPGHCHSNSISHPPSNPSP